MTRCIACGRDAAAGRLSMSVLTLLFPMDGTNTRIGGDFGRIVDAWDCAAVISALKRDMSGRKDTARSMTWIVHASPPARMTDGDGHFLEQLGAGTRPSATQGGCDYGTSYQH